MAQQNPSPLNSSEPSEQAFTFGNLRLEADGRLLRGNQVIHLPPKELAALRLLLANAGQIITQQHMKQALWGDVNVTADSVPKCMSSLRERLAPDDCIQTVYKRGYRLSVEVQKRAGVIPEGLPRLAIMPFEIGPNVAVHLGSAIAEEIVSVLTADRLAPVLVIARDSVFALAVRGFTAQRVGEALRADLILTGTLRALPEHFRLRAEMIRVADGIQLWVEDFLVPQARTAGLESELAQRLLVRLNGESLLSISASAVPGSEQDDPIRREAHDLFLRGHHAWQKPDRHQMESGVQHLVRAIELDPALISAHIDLANACATQEFYGFISPSVAAAQIRKAVDAIPTSIEGAEAVLPAYGWIRFHVDHDLQGALDAFASSAHLLHDTSTTRLRSMFALSRHRFAEAIDLLGAALRADPYSPWLNSRLAWAYHLAGDGARSVKQIEHALELFPEHEAAGVYGTVIFAFNGNPQRAIEVSENLGRRSPYLDLSTAAYAYALACAGRHEEARLILERLEWLSRERFVLSSFTPAVLVALGDLSGALAELRAASDARCPWFFQMLADPRMKPLHAEPEFVKMCRILENMETSAQLEQEPQLLRDRPTPTNFH